MGLKTSNITLFQPNNCIGVRNHILLPEKRLIASTESERLGASISYLLFIFFDKIVTVGGQT